MDKPSSCPPGALLHYDFISPELEQEVLQKLCHELEWPHRSGRRSLHYGYTFCYKTFKIDRDIPYLSFPEWLVPLLPRGEPGRPDQVCIQHYPPGAGIPPHADTHSAFDQLYSLSLGSAVMMQFCDSESGEKLEADLPPRSMLQLAGDARLHWTHAIRARKTDPLPDGTIRPRQDRWSITYRWLREPAVCECGNEKLCDTTRDRRGHVKEYRWKDSEQKEQLRGVM